jgi:release factor glutamine methyltransferase
MSDEPWTIGRLLQWTIEYLGPRDSDNPRLEAEVLLAAARGCKRIDLYTAYGEEASEAIRTKFRDMVRQRAAGAPVAYLVGHKEFYSLEFEVTPDVLIPRPETELLVVAMLDHVKSLAAGDVSRNAGVEIADVGTGSGILAVCAAKFLPTAHVTAIDVSSAALAVARRNAEKHSVADRIEFIESNLFSGVAADKQFDVIVSNPPYVSATEMAELPPDVKNYEPHLALAAGERGTDVVGPLITQSVSHLRSGGALFIEISPMIATAVEQLVKEQSALEVSETLCDAAARRRVVQARRKD